MKYLYSSLKKLRSHQSGLALLGAFTLFLLMFIIPTAHGQSSLELTSETPTGDLLTDSCQPALSSDNLYRELDSGLLMWIAQECRILPKEEVKLTPSEVKDYENFVLKLLEVNPKIDGLEIAHNENTKIIIKRQGPT
mgnify:CR=1 FL=1